MILDVQVIRLRSDLTFSDYVSGLANRSGSGTLGFPVTRVKGGWKTTRAWSRQLQTKYTINHNMIITYQNLRISFTFYFRYFYQVSKVQGNVLVEVNSPFESHLIYLFI